MVAVVGHLQDPRDARRLAPFRVRAEKFVLAAGGFAMWRTWRDQHTYA